MKIQNWSIFSLNIDLKIFLKSFLCYKSADFEISKKGLKVSLKFFIVIHA